MPTGLSPPPDSDTASSNDAGGYVGGSTFDEAFDPNASPRSHWLPFFASLADLGPEELARRWRDAQHLIRENGVTYNVYGDASGVARPWQLDPIPLLIPPTEAAALERGLVQRARLLELVLADFYGPQRLLHDNLIPPPLVFANPGFLRSCHGFHLPGNRYLHLYAANLGRTSDGAWHVLGDRTQTPSGAGYALENRIVMTRALPEAFGDCQVHRLALFFRTFRDSLRELAPRNKDNPRTVLLTPGPFNETYFEHAYLARYLGYTLAEGGDLTVRDNRVYLKVLDGLQPVDVIFRRLDDDFCDPLELRPDSFLGVPGLVHAVRSGNVAVANALGTGLVETPALLAYLPRLCRELLGEDQLLPSVPTWWCGDPSALRYVLEHLPELVVKPAFPASRLATVFPAELSREQRDALAKRIAARPREYVAQARLDLSTAPVLSGGRMSPRRMVLRTYLAADRDGYAMMPGGLTRVSAAADTSEVSMQRGGGSKDTWVLADGPVIDFSLLPAGGQVELTRAGGPLPSRAADNLFWLGRYAERAEGTTRLLRAITARLADRTGLDDAAEIVSLLGALSLQADADTVVEGFDDPAAPVLAIMFDPNRAGSLATVVRSLRRVAGTVRDLISTDMWRALNGLADFPTDPVARYGAEGPTPADMLHLLDRTVITLAAFGGLAVDSMTRAEGWRFLDMGRKLERTQHIVALLRGTLIRPVEQEGTILDAVLEVADSGMTYRRRYLNRLQAAAVIDLLILDEANPRSLAFQLAALDDDVNHLPRPIPRVGRSEEQRLTLSALTRIRLSSAPHLAEIHDGERPELVDLLNRIGRMVPVLSDTIVQAYLSHLQASRHLASYSLDDTRRTAADSGDPL